MQKKTYRFRTSPILISSCLLLFGHFLFSQTSWRPIQQDIISKNPLPLVKENYFEFTDTQNTFEFSSAKSNTIRVLLPNEKGQEELFELRPVPVLSLALSKQYNHIQTFKGKSVQRPQVKVRLSKHLSGVNAWIQLPGKEDLFIQPVKGKAKVHFVYQKTKNDKAQEFYCKTIEKAAGLKNQIKTKKSTQANTQLRTFRIAIVGTGEFTNYWGDDDPSNGNNTEDAFGAVVSTINRISQVFEDEVGVRLELVSDATLMYEDANTDPFTGNFASELQTTLDEVIGDEAYDVGHLFDFGDPDGDAGCIGCVCESNKKGQGFSTHPFIDIYGGEYRNDYFDLDYAAHEIGHQFGAYHSFSFQTEGRGFNAEPGSGSTIMGYAGITGKDDLQLHGDPYFHYYSIQNIRDTVEELSCGESETIFQESFTVDAGSDYSIPIGTPYELSIPEIEGEGITYCWEQLDSGLVTSENFGPYEVFGSMARSLPPKSIPSRIIPNKEQLLSNSLTQENPGVDDAWETTSLVERKLNWGLSVRKEQGDFVQVAQDKMEIAVVKTTTPFAVKSQARESLVWYGGSNQKILWDVAQTNEAPFNVSTVEILLSIDGGENFSLALSGSAPNTGEAWVSIPNNIDTSKARLKVKANQGIFFALNSANFSIVSRDLVLNFEDFQQENCDSDSIQYNFEIERKDTFDSSFTIQMNDLPEDVSAVVSKNNYTSSDRIGSIVLNGFSELPPGDYDFSVEAVYGLQREVFHLNLKNRGSIQSPPKILSPIDKAVDQSVSTLLSWEGDENIDSILVQVATDALFQNKTLEATTTQTQLTISDLSPNQKYYWRIKGENYCGLSDFSETYSFSTNVLSCVEVEAGNLPQNLNDADSNSYGVLSSSIEVNYDLPIQDIDVFVDIEHTFTEDLTLFLQTPEGIKYLLASGLGGDSENYTNTIFDEEGVLSIDEGISPFTGSFKPLESIKDLYGSSAAGTWQLIVEDRFIEDTGRLVDFKISFCLEGTPLPNSDTDTIVDELDNCPEISNQDQSDIDQNGIGDVCDLFSTQNITITKEDTSCPNKANGSLSFNALADFAYNADIRSDNGFQKTLSFSNYGNSISNLAEGLYSICIYVEDFPEYEFCFESEITSPESLQVLTSFNKASSILNIDLNGSDSFWVSINDESFIKTDKKELALTLTQKLNHVVVKTSNPCQGVFEEWINISNLATVFPNPVVENATIVLPQNINAQLNLSSSSGMIVWSRDHDPSQGNTIEIPMGVLGSGFYILQIIYPNNVETLKLLKR